MIREADPFTLGAFTPPAISRLDSPVVSATAHPQERDPESNEQEIARLTWSVLDGSASLPDRERLAELVNAQHARRRRFDS